MESLNYLINHQVPLNFNNDDYNNSIIDYSISTYKILDNKKYLLRDLDFDKKEYINLLGQVWCYQLPSVSNNTDMDILIKFVHTFKFINNKAKEKDLRKFLKNLSVDMVNTIVNLFNSIIIVDKKQLFTKKRTIIFNNKLIISNNKFTNGQYNEFLSYKEQLKKKAQIEKKLITFKSIYERSNNTISNIIYIYKQQDKSITSRTITKYANILKLELLNNTSMVNYEESIKYILNRYNKHIRYEDILSYINQKNDVKICLKTLKNNMTVEMKNMIKKHNSNLKLKTNGKIDNRQLIINYYKKNLKKKAVISNVDMTTMIYMSNFTEVYIKELLKEEFGKLKYERKDRKANKVQEENVEQLVVIKSNNDYDWLKDTTYIEKSSKKDDDMFEKALKDLKSKTFNKFNIDNGNN